jgi:hypothetical protein
MLVDLNEAVTLAADFGRGVPGSREKLVEFMEAHGLPRAVGEAGCDVIDSADGPEEVIAALPGLAQLLEGIGESA